MIHATAIAAISHTTMTAETITEAGMMPHPVTSTAMKPAMGVDMLWTSITVADTAETTVDTAATTKLK